MAIAKQAGLLGSMRAEQAKIVEAWRGHRTVQRFLSIYEPDIWEKVRVCGLGAPRVWVDGELYKHQARHCHQIPWCIVCTQKAAWRRIMDTRDAFRRCTPQGEQPRFIHIVQTAPPYEPYGAWGMRASQLPKQFGAMVWDVIRQFWDGDLGAVMSYQDFGEQFLAQRYPHQDLTLNGWALTDDGPKKLGDLDLSRDRRRWDEAIVQGAQRFALGARGGSMNVDRVAVGWPAYKRALAYQMREMVDLTKMYYDHERREVLWTGYDGTRTKYSVRAFRDGLEEYGERLGLFRGRKGTTHRRYGHMSKGRLRRTAASLGRGRECPKDCLCRECRDWEPVYPDEAYDVVRYAPRWKVPT